MSGITVQLLWGLNSLFCTFLERFKQEEFNLVCIILTFFLEQKFFENILIFINKNDQLSAALHS